jgi:hypothetical protein
MKDSLKVTFGIVNCNRLHYLKSCLESLMYCTEDYENKEIIIVDNASIEDGTDKYLLEKEKQGIKVFRQAERDPANEFARGCNIIVSESTGDLVAPLQGDSQFVIRGGWLDHFSEFYKKYMNVVGSTVIDAQRTVRNKSNSFSEILCDQSYPFAMDLSRIPFSCSANAIYSKTSLDYFGPWSEDNKSHEGGMDSENDMRKRVLSALSKFDNPQFFCGTPLFTPMAAIYTDPRGTNSRIRGDKRYGQYWPPKSDFRYYKIFTFDEASRMCANRDIPIGIEEIAIGEGWDVPIDSDGNWKKNPIRPETATSLDWSDINETIDYSKTPISETKGYIDEWMSE